MTGGREKASKLVDIVFPVMFPQQMRHVPDTYRGSSFESFGSTSLWSLGITACLKVR